MEDILTENDKKKRLHEKKLRGEDSDDLYGEEADLDIEQSDCEETKKRKRKSRQQMDDDEEQEDDDDFESDDEDGKSQNDEEAEVMKYMMAVREAKEAEKSQKVGEKEKGKKAGGSSAFNSAHNHRMSDVGMNSEEST